MRFRASDAEFAELAEAASRAGLALGTYAARASLAAARSVSWPDHQLLRETLRTVLALQGEFRRIGTNLNQAVAALNATGQFPAELPHYAEYIHRRVLVLDDVADEICRRLP